MPSYYFHLIERDEIIRDTEGAELSDLTAVQSEAIRGASSLIADAVSTGECDYRGGIRVEDERGTMVFSLTFACPITIEIMPLVRSA